MTLETIYFISQIAAAVGVMASLIFVGMQIKQQNQLSRFSAARDIMVQYNALNSLVVGDAALRRAILKNEPLTEDEELQLYAIVAMRCNIWISIQTAYTTGQADKAAFLALKQDVHRELTSYPHVADALLRYLKDNPGIETLEIFEALIEYSALRDTDDADENTEHKE